MERRNAARALAVAVTATVVGTTSVSQFADPAWGLLVSLVGLVATWVVCVRGWRAVRRPRPFRLVCAPIGQLLCAFIVALISAADLRAEDNPWAFVGVWLFTAGGYVFMSVLFAGFLRDKDFSTGAGQGI
ncbi:hypothetical protein IDM40_09530 [Nocardiopsis sp. HNM0947]|uniref:Uncharacterized protein n=1 Tax=Nocardiopsis coralli TaxID=2772213 RepID=A0ABR9P513_9ACTN|nr:hypothetical protein [Nocardiopsis coralli]MBE2998942.1 hypothetical protein [Nocardiopsis coralli]